MVSGPSLLTTRKGVSTRVQGQSLSLELVFSDSHLFCSKALVCCCFMVRGLGEHLIMQLTWVPWFVAMVIAKGA